MKDPNILIGLKKLNQEIIQFVEYNKRNRKVYKIRCNYCNHEYFSTIENFRDVRRSGQSCLKCSNMQNREYSKLNMSDSQTSIIYSNYKSKSKKKNWKFDLTKEEFKEIISKNCHYCNLAPNNFRIDRIKGKREIDCAFLSNGIDRIDSNKGYTKDNVLPCCEDCNKAKRNLDYNTFINLIKSIYKNLNLDEKN